MYVLAKIRYAPEYFVFAPETLDEWTPPASPAFRDHRRDFELVVREELGREHRFRLTATHQEQAVKLRFKPTLGRRLQMAKDGLDQLRRAFSRDA